MEMESDFWYLHTEILIKIYLKLSSYDGSLQAKHSNVCKIQV